jgi:hypothetical protein
VECYLSVPPPVATARVAADEVQRQVLLSSSWCLQVQGVNTHVSAGNQYESMLQTRIPKCVADQTVQLSQK